MALTTQHPQWPTMASDIHNEALINTNKKTRITRITVEFTKLNFKIELTIYCCVHTIPEIDESVIGLLYIISTIHRNYD